MFSVGLDEFINLILYSQLNGVKIENNKPFISNEVKEILFGSLLGDGKLELPPRGLNARFGFIQSLDKKDYFLSVFNKRSAIVFLSKVVNEQVIRGKTNFNLI